MAKDTTPLEEFRRVTATTMRAISKKDVNVSFVPDGGSLATVVKPGTSFTLKDFKTSTGLEVRFFMPVLNVPFRLIFAYNPQRDGVRDNTLFPQKAFQFRFAVGSTF